MFNIHRARVKRGFLEKTDPERRVFLALPARIHEGLLSEPFGLWIIARVQLRYLVFSEDEKKVLQWIN